MYQSDGGRDVNVPPLPVRRSAAVHRQSSPGTPPLPLRHHRQPTTTAVRPELPTSSSSSRLNLTNLDQRVNSPRSRALNDYRDFPTTTTTTVSRPTDRTQQMSPQDVVGSQRKRDGDKGDDGDHERKIENKSNKTPLPDSSSECRGESIICQRCGRCRCQLCARHPTKTCSRRAVELCSCVSCVRRVVAVRRHRRPSDVDVDDSDDDDDPCSCGPRGSDCRRRWVLLVVLSVCVPCLCLYWPLRCLVGACSRCAAGGRRTRRGCHCVERRSASVQLCRRRSPPTESVLVERVTTT